MVVTKTFFKAKHPENIPDEFYKPIGQIMARFTFTDLYLQSIIWRVLKIRDVKAARLLTIGRTATDIQKLFESLQPHWIKNQVIQAEIKEIKKEFNEIRAFRNRLAHGQWAYKAGEKPRRWRLFFLNDNEKKINPSHIFVTERSLQEWVSRLVILNASIKTLHKRLGAPIP